MKKDILFYTIFTPVIMCIPYIYNKLVLYTNVTLALIVVFLIILLVSYKAAKDISK